MFEYKLKYGKRRTIAVSVRGGEVIVHVPEAYAYSATIRRRTEEFLRLKSAWIERKLAEERTATEECLPGLSRHKTPYLFGTLLPVVQFDGKSAKFDGKTLFVPAVSTADALNDALIRWYKRYAKTALEKRLSAISAQCGIKYNSFGITSARRKWGSCSSSGKVLLNYRLVVLPMRLVDYVILHELCHMKVLDHSAAFWANLAAFMPDYKMRRKELKNYGFVMDTV